MFTAHQECFFQKSVHYCCLLCVAFKCNLIYKLKLYLCLHILRNTSTIFETKSNGWRPPIMSLYIHIGSYMDLGFEWTKLEKNIYIYTQQQMRIQITRASRLQQQPRASFKQNQMHKHKWCVHLIVCCCCCSSHGF